MIKTISIAIVIITALNFGFSQNMHENNWVFASGKDGVILTFDGDSLQIEYIPTMNMRMREASISMSDEFGSLLFYSNNCYVANAVHQMMDNGDSLNPGIIQESWCTSSNKGNPHSQSILSLPDPAQTNIYHLFHLDEEIFFGKQPGSSDFSAINLYHTLIDMNENGGLGKVLVKNHSVLNDSLSGGDLQAVRHGNGKDWWIICPEYRSNCYYSLLLSSKGIQIINKQCLGTKWKKFDETGGNQFTYNGSKYIRSHSENGLNIFDFDRCSGQLSNPIHISLAPDTNAISSLAVSPNSQYIYIIFRQKIFQFDLLASDVAASKTLVASYDGTISAGNKTDFYHGKLAPNGQIYISTYNPTYFLHTISDPDSAGLKCNVLQHNILLPITHYAAVPNAPNYKLEQLTSLCDTTNISSNAPSKNELSILTYPNPAVDQLNVRMVGGSNQISSIQIVDLMGNILYWRHLQSHSCTIDMGELVHHNGVFVIKVEDSAGYIYCKKVIKL